MTGPGTASTTRHPASSCNDGTASRQHHYSRRSLETKPRPGAGQVIVNGKALEESYVPDEYRDRSSYPARPVPPGSPEWDAMVVQHQEFGAAAGPHIKSGAGLHPPSTATTVRVRDGEALITDGPYIEGAEVANGFYVLSAADRDEAVKIASMIPASTVELRQRAGVSGL